jgi:hypothetical protein
MKIWIPTWFPYKCSIIASLENIEVLLDDQKGLRLLDFLLCHLL